MSEKIKMPSAEDMKDAIVDRQIQAKEINTPEKLIGGKKNSHKMEKTTEDEKAVKALKLFGDDECEEYEGFVMFDKNGKMIAAQDIRDEETLKMSEAEIRRHYAIQEKTAKDLREMATQHGFFCEGRNSLGGGSNQMIIEKK